jgi:hypothetical protein
MANRETTRAMLSEGRNRISSGRAAEVVDLVRANPKRARQLLECLWDEESAVAMRAADALEKLTRCRTSDRDPALKAILALLQRSWKEPLIGQLGEATENKLRWCLASVAPRLRLTASECRRVAEILQSCLGGRSSIVKTCALQGLADLARQDDALLPEAIDLLRIHGRSGTAAMRARGRMQLKQMESAGVKRFAGFITGDARTGKHCV